MDARKQKGQTTCQKQNWTLWPRIMEHIICSRSFYVQLGVFRTACAFKALSNISLSATLSFITLVATDWLINRLTHPWRFLPTKLIKYLRLPDLVLKIVSYKVFRTILCPWLRFKLIFQSKRMTSSKNRCYNCHHINCNRHYT